MADPVDLDLRPAPGGPEAPRRRRTCARRWRSARSAPSGTPPTSSPTSTWRPSVRSGRSVARRSRTTMWSARSSAARPGTVRPGTATRSTAPRTWRRACRGPRSRCRWRSAGNPSSASSPTPGGERCCTPWRSWRLPAGRRHCRGSAGLPDGLAGRVVMTEWAAHVPWPGMLALPRRPGRTALHGEVMGSGTLWSRVAAGRAAGAVISTFHPEDHLAAVLLCRPARWFATSMVGARGRYGALLVAAPGVDAALSRPPSPATSHALTGGDRSKRGGVHPEPREREHGVVRMR